LVLISTIFFNRPSTWISIATIFLPMGLNMVIFVLLFRFVPSKLVYWDAVWPSAIFGAVGWELAKAGFRWYLQNLANYQIVYGGIATVIVLLFSAYLLASIFIFSAELCAQLNEWLARRHEPENLRLHIEQTIPQLPE
jgi:membrane protein